MAEAKRKIIIVCDDQTKKYGAFLSQLISSDGVILGKEVGPKAGEVQAVVWTEKDYHANSVKISSDQYVLFIGNGKLAREQRSHMISQFSYYGMHYEWLGKKATLFVDSTMNRISEYRDFYNFIIEYKPETVSLIESKETDRVSSPIVDEIEDVILDCSDEVPEQSEEDSNEIDELKEKVPEEKKPNKLLIGLSNVVGKAKQIQQNTQNTLDDTIGGGNPIKQTVIKGKIHEQQYDCLILAFYQKGLSEFLGL